MAAGGGAVCGHPRLCRRALAWAPRRAPPCAPSTISTFSARGQIIDCRVCADGFLYNMVRAMVGTCVYAAEGKLAPEDIPEILASRNRTASRPHGPARTGCT